MYQRLIAKGNFRSTSTEAESVSYNEGTIKNMSFGINCSRKMYMSKYYTNQDKC